MFEFIMPDEGIPKSVTIVSPYVTAMSPQAVTQNFVDSQVVDPSYVTMSPRVTAKSNSTWIQEKKIPTFFEQALDQDKAYDLEKKEENIFLRNNDHYIFAVTRGDTVTLNKNTPENLEKSCHRPGDIGGGAVTLSGDTLALPAELWRTGLAFTEAWALWQALRTNYKAALGHNKQGFYVTAPSDWHEGK